MQELPISKLKNKNNIKTFFCQLLVTLGVALSHVVLISLFTQKYAVQRHLHSDSTTTSKVFNVRLIVDRPLTSKLSDPITDSLSGSETPSIAPVIAPPEQASPAPDLAPEKSDSLLGQETPTQAGFIASSQLSEKPVVQVDINPNISLRLATNVNRVAILRIRIDELGGIDQVFFERGDFTKTEIEYLINACKAMKFAPGKLGTKSIKTEMRIEMTIEAQNRIQLSR